MFKKLEETLDQFLKIGIPGNDCIVCLNGDVVYRKQRGFSDREKQIPMTGKEQYSIFSCSKPITCTAALQLWEKGLFDLDDELCKYMPEFTDMKVVGHGGLVPAKNRIKIKNLFTMSAGFNYNGSCPSIKKCWQETEGKCPTREVMKYLAKEPLDFEPGEKWQYSLCHDVLAAFVEVVSGMEFNAYVTKNIFEPLGMTHSSYLLPADQFKNENMAAQYLCIDEKTDPVYFENFALGNQYNPFRFGSEHASGGAGCVSTVEDYIRFLNAMSKGDVILKKDTIAMMTTNQLTEAQTAAYNNENHAYGLGVRCPKSPDSIYQDSGWDGAAGAFALS
jgi:CubicO group peptidase (beta-lactamase class C family)